MQGKHSGTSMSPFCLRPHSNLRRILPRARQWSATNLGMGEQPWQSATAKVATDTILSVGIINYHCSSNQRWIGPLQVLKFFHPSCSLFSGRSAWINYTQGTESLSILKCALSDWRPRLSRELRFYWCQTDAKPCSLHAQCSCDSEAGRDRAS